MPIRAQRDPDLYNAGWQTRKPRQRTQSPRSRLRGERPGLLTRRELEVLELLAEGLSRKEIAARLMIATETVRNHCAAIFETLDVPCAAGAVGKGFRAGLLK
jgi:DNA-binding NarL/FixJ family response regulator